MMFDFIRDGLEFNIGVVYSNCIANPQWIYRDTLTANGNLASAYKSKQKIYARSIEKFIETLTELKDMQS